MEAMRKTLDHVHVFQRLTPERRSTVAARCQWRDVPAGTLIVAHEDVSRTVFFLTSGRARSLIYAASGTMVGFGELLAGQMFGEVQAIDGKPRAVAVEAVEACTVASLSADAFIELVRSEPDFAVTVLEQIASNIRALTARVFEFSTMSVPTRLHAELLRLAGANGEPVAEGIRLRTTPTHAEFAARISTHREAVTRELNRLQKLGVLAKEDRAIVVVSPQKLRLLIKEATGG
jgi:CRP/FNR family transcriptional regulator, cyclic AMP receptor protein